MTNADFYLEDLRTKFLKIDPEKYHLSYSGGKDSHLLFWFLKTWLKDHYPEMFEVYKAVTIVSINTRMEWPEILERMKKNADVVLSSDMKPHEVIQKYGTPCFSKQSDEIIGRYQKGMRTHSVMSYIEKINPTDGQPSMFGLSKSAHDMLLADKLPKISSLCCKYLKKIPAHDYEKRTGKKPILGVIGDESIRRKAKYTSCFTKSGIFTPLWDLPDEIENDIYQQFKIETPEIYKYVNQTGCAGCPYGIGLKHTEKELTLMTPAKRKYVCGLFGEAYRIRNVDTNKPLQEALF